MSNLICVAGQSNSGKSTSLRTLDPKSTFIISCTNKQLQIPGFRKKYPKVEIKDKKLVGNWYVQNKYDKIESILDLISKTRPEIKVVVLDDINYLLSNETFENATTKGYEKFTLMAKNYYDLLTDCQLLRDDLTIVVISHTENFGTELDPQYRLWTTGKMLTNQINLDGMFSYIIYSERIVDDVDGEVHYRFKTRTDGNDTCRSVAGCFEDKYIEPDMKLVIDTINTFENED
nr:MAG TPA: RecA like NTPase recombinase [Crassvirales sp.]